MITTATAILLPCLPLGIAAGVGWIRCGRILFAARELASNRQIEAVKWRRLAEQQITRAERLYAEVQAASKAGEKAWRSRWGNVMRLLRLAEDANQELRTAQLIREQAERVDAAADLQDAA